MRLYLDIGQKVRLKDDVHGEYVVADEHCGRDGEHLGWGLFKLGSSWSGWVADSSVKAVFDKETGRWRKAQRYRR